MGIKSNRKSTKRKEMLKKNTLWMLLFVFDFYLSNSSSPSLSMPFHPKIIIILLLAKDCKKEKISLEYWGLLRFITSQSIWNERNHKKILFQHRIDKKSLLSNVIRIVRWVGETEKENYWMIPVLRSFCANQP